MPPYRNGNGEKAERERGRGSPLWQHAQVDGTGRRTSAMTASAWRDVGTRRSRGGSGDGGGLDRVVGHSTQTRGPPAGTGMEWGAGGRPPGERERIVRERPRGLGREREKSPLSRRTCGARARRGRPRGPGRVVCGPAREGKRPRVESGDWARRRPEERRGREAGREEFGPRTEGGKADFSRKGERRSFRARI